MDADLLKKIAYSMQQAYIHEKTLGDACHAVAEQYPDVNDHTFKAMWLAIDAYVDLNT